MHMSKVNTTKDHYVFDSSTDYDSNVQSFYRHDEETTFPDCDGLRLYDEECSASNNTQAFISEKALRMMAKMGYQSGTGLGKNAQGTTEAINISHHFGTRGFGSKTVNFEYTNEPWDFDKDEVRVKEDIEWISNEEQNNFNYSTMKNWIKEGNPKLTVDDEFNFCDKEMLHRVLTAKNIFHELDGTELDKARARANPFETIQKVFFMNRAALKMANIDTATDYIFTDVDKNIHHQNGGGLYYFADVCAGPGGFTEYVLWRTKDRQSTFKGFGFTLKKKHDFEIDKSSCSSFATFGAYYGESTDGNVCNPRNIADFKNRVLHQTEKLGVHFMMSDGGFSVEGKENMQEVLSKSLYICQCLVALEIVREHGHFVTKLFDTFTPFSVGLIYLMWNCFEKELLNHRIAGSDQLRILRTKPEICLPDVILRKQDCKTYIKTSPCNQSASFHQNNASRKIELRSLYSQSGSNARKNGRQRPSKVDKDCLKNVPTMEDANLTDFPSDLVDFDDGITGEYSDGRWFFNGNLK